LPWQYDGNLSRVEWAVTYLGIATVKGTFRDVQAKLELDAPGPLDWKTSITIAAASVYTGYQQLDDHLRHADFLDAERYPTIEFVSKQVEMLPSGDHKPASDKFPGVVAWEPRADHFRLSGDMTLHGVTRPAQLDGWYWGQATDVRGRTRRVFEARTSVRRSDFGIYVPPQIDASKVVAGERVTIDIAVIATKVED
jgi:polyisoprenoid-binding protein YceI